MSIFKCKMCGGDLNVIEGVTVSECAYCGTKQTLPRVGEESIANLFNRANRLRMHCEFDKAEEVYEKIINLDDAESEAHWGMVLCKYGIEYVEDPKTFERIPTCHRASFEAVTEDNDYISAIENADPIRKELYEKEARKIEELQKNVLQIVNKEKPFDVFICYKETDETGERTADSVLAQEIYDQLSEKGYRVFFSRITLEDKLGVEYEPYIFAALNSAKVMLVIGTKPAHMEAVWVRNEWSRYLKLMKKDHSKLLIPCYKDMDPYDMPEAFSHLQAQNLAKIGAIQDLIRGVGKIVKSGENAAEVYTAASNSSALIDNAMSYLRDGNFSIAETTCNQILKIDSENGMAYIGKLMAELKIKEFTAKDFYGKKYKKSPYYAKALEYGDEFVKEKLNGIEVASKKIKRKNKVILFSSIATVIISIITFFIVREILYRSTINKFLEINKQLDYSTLAEDFEKFNGYKESEAYLSLCQILLNPGTVNQNIGVKKVVIPNIPLLMNYMKNGVIDKAFPTLEEVVFAEDVKYIPDNALKSCGNLSKVTIPDGVTSIGNDAFNGCSKLKNVTIPDGVTSIGNDAFKGCWGIESVCIPNSVEKIGTCAFANCSGLKTVVISNNIDVISSSAFSNCDKLESVEIPQGVSIIGDSAFDSCNNLVSVTVPSSVYSIGYFAFSACENLTDIHYEGSEADREKIGIRDSKILEVTWHYNSNY